MTVRKEIEQNEWLETKVENRTDAMFKNEVIKNRVLMNFLISVWDHILRSKDFHKIFNFFFILSHGQSFTQRTSSLNKAITDFNIHKENLSCPLVYL